MPVPIIRYSLDPTGENPDNLVVGETHTLSDHPVRAVAPLYGPFFAKSCILYDMATNEPLAKDRDYKTLHLLQDATLTFGEEICELILITNEQVSNKVSITYQNVGGNYQNHSKAVADSLEALLKDARPVDWVNGIFNKPNQYTPAPHPHLFVDTIGYGPLLVALDRLGQAFTLSNVPAFEALIDWVQNNQKVWVSETEVSSMENVAKAVSMERLLYASKRLNFNAITFRADSTKLRLGKPLGLSLSCTNYVQGENIYWTIEHDQGAKATKDSMFGSTNGIVTPINQQARFVINTLRNSQKYGDYRFKVLLRRNNISGPVLAESGYIDLVHTDPAKNSDLALANGMWEHVCCVSEPGIVLTAEAAYLARDSFNYQTLSFQ